MSLNKVILIGRIGKDPEHKMLPNGTGVVQFSLATSEKYTKDGQKQEKTEWHNVVFFGKTADIINQYCKKGMQVYVDGKIQTRQWDDQSTGQKKYKTEIVGNEIKFLGSVGSGNQNQQSGGFSDDSVPTPEEDLPF
jgi:single-strand DNA-binding protein